MPTDRPDDDTSAALDTTPATDGDPTEGDGDGAVVDAAAAGDAEASNAGAAAVAEASAETDATFERASAGDPSPKVVAATGEVLGARPASGEDGTHLPSGEITDVHLIAEQLGASAEARRVLWPWIARRTRSQVVALVLISFLALGPAFALVVILRSDHTPVEALVTAPPADEGVTRVTLTAIRVSPSAGEMQTRVSIEPSTDLLDPAGKLAQPVSVSVNGTQGTTTTTFREGETTSVFEVSIPLSEGTTQLYPFDSYRGSSVVLVTADSEDSRVASPSVIDARSSVSDFELEGFNPTEATSAGQSLSVVDWYAKRPATTTVYAVWLMVLMWGLAVIGLLIVWAVVIWMVDLPFWAVGYLVGVLFALPPLRESLPGRPPPGNVFDFVSFYWSIALIGVSLILILAVWLRRVRSESHLRDLDDPRLLEETAEP